MSETPETRSRNMAAIRSKDTKVELKVRSALHRAGFRFRLHRNDLPGRPDLALPKYYTVIFVNGCFWHGHTCSDGHIPKTNTEYWGAKSAGNLERDQRNHERLTEMGWRVTVLYECEVGRELPGLISALGQLKSRTLPTDPRGALRDRQSPVHR